MLTVLLFTGLACFVVGYIVGVLIGIYTERHPVYKERRPR